MHSEQIETESSNVFVIVSLLPWKAVDTCCKYLSKKELLIDMTVVEFLMFLDFCEYSEHG